MLKDYLRFLKVGLPIAIIAATLGIIILLPSNIHTVSSQSVSVPAPIETPIPSPKVQLFAPKEITANNPAWLYQGGAWRQLDMPVLGTVKQGYLKSLNTPQYGRRALIMTEKQILK